MNTESPTTVESPPEKSFRKYAFRLSLIVAVSALLGLAPIAVFFRNTTFLIVIVAIGAVGSFLTFFGQAKTLVYRPGAFESLLATLYSMGFWAFLGLAWLSIYLILFWLIKLAGQVYSPLEAHADNIAAIGSFALSCVLSIGVSIAVSETMTRRFFSSNVSSRAAFYYRALREHEGTLLYVLASFGVVALMGLGLWYFRSSSNILIYYGIQFLPYIAGLWLINFGVRARSDSGVFLAVVRLLESAGYETVISPRSEDNIADGLLSGIDMLAYDKKHTFLVKVKTQSGSTEPVEWTVGSSLKNKARALVFYRLTAKVDLPYLHEQHIQPLMVLCGRAAHESLVEFSREEEVPVVTLDMNVIDRVIEATDYDVQQLASQHFAFLEHAHVEVSLPEVAITGQEAKQ